MIDTSNVPAELQALPQWVGWRLAHRDGKPTKVPMRPDGAGPASAIDPATWGTIDQALDAARRYKYSGVGFVFTAEDPYTGIDLDKCRDPQTGELADWAAEIVRQFPDAYVEASPSETGIHIITRGVAPHNGKTPYEGGAVELYDRSRYFTITGRGTATGQLPDHQHAIDALARRIFPAPEPKRTPAAFAPELGMDAQEIRSLASRASNGPEIDALFYGDMCGRPGESEARGALILLFIFYTRDPGLLEQLLRASGRDPSKFDTRRGSETFLQYEIRRALEKYDGETYKPRRAPAPVVEYVMAGASTDDRIAALEARIGELERTVRTQTEIIDTQRSRLQQVELEGRATRNPKLKQAAPALVEIARKVEEIRNLRDTERRDPDGYCKLWVGEKDEAGSLAAAVGLSSDSISRYIDLGERAGLLRTRHTRELKDVVNKKTGEVRSAYVPQVWASYDGTLTEQLQRIADYNPKPEERARVVKKVYCKKHPDAQVIRFTTYKCGECGDLLQSDTEVDPDPPDDGETIPQLAGTYYPERGQGTIPQLAGRSIETGIPTCSSTLGGCSQPGYCAKQGRCRWTPVATLPPPSIGDRQ